MADIELVIKLNEDIAQGIIDGKNDVPRNIVRTFQATIAYAIKNGTPLPKGHGDLIDREMIEYLKAIHDLKWGKISASECATKIKYSAPTIIEADKRGNRR